MRTLPPLASASALDGYWAETRGRKLTELAPPAVNMFISSAGKPYTRPGFEATAWDLSNADHAHEGLWVSEYNVTFFASDNKVLYVDHEKSDVVYDTGLSLTAETHLSYYNGAVYATNPTDGVYRIGLTRLDTAASAAAVEVFVEDGTVYRFDTTGTLRIKGTNEAYTGRDTTDWKFTGMSLSQGYDSGDLVIQTKSLSSIPKLEKIVFWEEAMHGYGPQTATSNQTAKRTLFYGDFAAAGTWTQHEAFTGGASGTQTVGKSGVLENIFEIEDYLYLFTTDETYSISVADVNRSTGARIPHIFSRKYTSQNRRMATDMDGRIVFVDLKKKRIIRSMVNQGGTLEPDEKFDAPMRNLLALMSTTQTDSLVYYWEEANYLICQLNIEGQNMALIYDNNPIVTDEGTSEGRWLPPVLNWQFKNYFTQNGTLHATDLTDDTIYQVATGRTDDGGEIQSVWAAGIYEIEEGRTMADWGLFEVSGGIANGTEVTYTSWVNEKGGIDHDFDSTGIDFGSAGSIGAVGIGTAIVGGLARSAVFGTFDKAFVVAPAKGRCFQPVLSSQGDGFAFKVDSWRLPKVKFYGRSATTAQ